MERTTIIAAFFGLAAGFGSGTSVAAEVSEGVNLFSPIRSTQTYLMDNDGAIVHTWSSAHRPGLSVYLLDDDTLLRTANTGGQSFDAGGAGGRVEQLDRDSNLIWTFDYSSTKHRLHHDVEILPNGNILMIAWELKTQTEAIAAGRDPSLLSEGELWPDHIIEVEPNSSSGGTIVWQWHVWDHLVQDHDPSKVNYGTVSGHPELADLNHVLNPEADWNHINSIDYNPELDQILLSVHNFGEIWIIDHSTTTAQAAGHVGGTSGRGGDLLYRWGNPQTYGAGTVSDQEFFVQHDAEWIADGLPGAGNILVFNNGRGRSDGNYSSVDEIVPPLQPDGSYAGGLPFGPASLTWTYVASPRTDFYADRISGSQRLANGNTLICDGPSGRFFEVNSDGDTVWEHLVGSNVFRVERYGSTDTDHTYWVEIAANLEGQQSSRWLTDLVVRNTSNDLAQITLLLHNEGGESSLTNTISGSAQAVFENVVGLLGVTGKGVLEIRSDQPLAAVARIYNQTDQGSFGQFLDAYPAGDGLAAGEGAWLLGLRQLDGSFRTNISVTNTGGEQAAVTVQLYANDSTLIHDYTLSVSPAEVIQDVEPFRVRAGESSLGWGFARVSVSSGSGVLSSASVIDSRTGDATTIAMKQ